MTTGPHLEGMSQKILVGDWLLDRGSQRLRRDGESHALNPKEMDVLLRLVSAAPDLVTTDALLQGTWADVVVGDHVVHEVIGRLRKTLGDSARRPRYIETLPKRGYRLIVPVEQDSDQRGHRPNKRNRTTIVLLCVAVLLLSVAYRYGGVLVSAVVLSTPGTFFGEPIDQEIGVATSADGTRILFAVSGEGPPLVYVLGWMTHLERGFNSPLYDNERVVAMTSEQHRFVRYDGRGFGMSDHDVEDFSLEARVNDLEAVVDAAGLERFAMLAVSAGGPIAIAFTAKHPNRVSGLVLGSTFASQSSHSEEARERNRRLWDYAELAWDKGSVTEMLAAAALEPNGTHTERAVLGALFRRCCDGPNVARYFRELDRVDLREEARQIRVPTLVLHARDDRIVPLEAGKELRAIIPNSRLKVVEGGHREGSGSTAETRQIALDFLAALEGRP